MQRSRPVRASAIVATAALALVLVNVVPAPAGAADSSSGVTARIVLARSRVSEGKPAKGTLMLANPGKQTVDLRTECTPQWDVALGRGREAPPVAFTQICGTKPFPVRPGVNRYPFESATKGLSPGRYRAFLVSSDPSFPSARPVALRVVRS